MSRFTLPFAVSTAKAFRPARSRAIDVGVSYPGPAPGASWAIVITGKTAVNITSNGAPRQPGRRSCRVMLGGVLVRCIVFVVLVKCLQNRRL